MTENGTFKYSIIIKAAAPINGGIICPPVDAEASVAAANSGLNPAFFIIGIVKDPEATVFPTELPETIPCKALAATAAFAVPPVYFPVTANAKSLKKLPILVWMSMTPKNKNRKMNLEEIWIGVPNTPLSRYHKFVAIRSIENPG